MSLEQQWDQPTIMDLPNEMLEKIFSHLKVTERLTASQVCRRWYGFALPWEKIRLWVKSSDEVYFTAILASERPYRHLKINGDLLAAELITKFGAHLEALKIVNVISWDWLGSLGGLPNLQGLKIKCHYRYDPLKDVPSCQPCPTLRCLTIEGIGSDVFPALNRFFIVTFPALEYLKVVHYTGKFRLSNLPTLEHLEMTSHNAVDDRLLQDIKALPKLRTVILATNKLHCDYPQEALNIDHIRTVRLGSGESTSYNDEDLIQLTAVFPGMTTFRIDGWTKCTYDGIYAARRRLPM